MITIQGWSYGENEFSLQEHGILNLGHAINRLLTGSIPIVLARNALDLSSCRALTEVFDRSPGRQERTDGVAGSVLGAYHYSQSFAEYIARIRSTSSHITNLLISGGNPVGRVLDIAREALAQLHVTMRPARWLDQDAAYCRAVSWSAPGEYLLLPHDDLGQLVDPQQSDFEVQQVASNTIVAVNIYVNVPAGGGELKLWNVIPDSDTREEFAASGTGYPYPPEALSAFTSLRVPLQSGDMVLMNGGLVHAVIGYKDRANWPDGDRLVINFFMGYIDERTVIHWI